MLHPATQATLSSILLSSVQGYTQSTPSPPPGLAPIDKQSNGVPDCSKGPCTLNGHVKVGPFMYLILHYYEVGFQLFCCMFLSPDAYFCVFILIQHPGSVYGRIATASLAETVLSPAPCDSVQEASGHNPSEPLSSKSSPDEGIPHSSTSLATLTMTNVLVDHYMWFLLFPVARVCCSAWIAVTFFVSVFLFVFFLLFFK